MRINSLQLENVRGFRGLHEVHFGREPVAVFIGVNGSGKSTLLESIAVGLDQVANSIGHLRSSKAMFLNNRNDVTVGLSEGSGSLEVSLQEDLPTLHANFFLKLKEDMQANLAMGEEVDTYLKRAIHDASLTLPVIGFYKTRNSVLEREVDYDQLLKQYGRTQTYFDATNPRINFAKVILWFTHQTNQLNKEIVSRRDFEYKDPAIEAVRSCLATFLSALEGDDGPGTFINLDVAPKEETFSYVKGNFGFNFSQLSDGEQIVVALALDIMYRCVTANPHLNNPLDSPGVVVIDEIELHLHPRWQANIVQALRTTFPNVQFIISTHSPLIVNQLRNEEVFLVSNEGILPGSNLLETYGMDVNSVISKVMGAPVRPTCVSEQFRTIEKLLDDPTPENLTTAQAALAKLATEISPDDSDLLQLDTILKLEQSEIDI